MHRVKGCGLRRGLASLLLSGWAWCGRAEAPDADALVVRARELNLASHPVWLSLLHMRPRIGGRWHSRIADPSFFVSPDGRTDPAAELEATLRGWFTPLPEEHGFNAHPTCRFVARYRWLQKQLGLADDERPAPECPVFEQVMDQLRVTSVTLAFPSAYVNNPASMFGHTLLVFDRDERNRLLARTVNYGAYTGMGLGPLFYFGSMVGLVQGIYAVLPYYEKVREYNAMDHRDIWEYELDLTPEETDRMVRHVWEIQNTWTRYYFFHQNCASALLDLIDVARPEAELRARFRAWVIPIDTLKAVSDAGMVRNVTYRPSAASELRALADALPREAVDEARALAGGERAVADLDSALPDPDVRRRTLGLAAIDLQQRLVRREVTQEAYRSRLLPVLAARSRLGPDPDPPRPAEPVRPDHGHAPARLGLGGGVQGGDGFARLTWRAAYHELTDDDAGFDPGAQIQFGALDLRYFPDGDRWRLEEFRLIDVLAVSPRDVFQRPASWRFETGVRQFRLPEEEHHPVAYLGSGGGVAWEWGGWRPFALLGFEAQSGGGYRNRVAAGPDLQAGLLIRPGGRWKSLVHGRAMMLWGGPDVPVLEASWTQNLSLGRNRALALRLKWEDHDGRQTREATAAMHWMF